MPMLWRMNLNPRKKFLVMLMFGTFLLALPRNNNTEFFFELIFFFFAGVGFFVTFVSILRLRLLVKFGESKNISCTFPPPLFSPLPPKTHNTTRRLQTIRLLDRHRNRHSPRLRLHARNPQSDPPRISPTHGAIDGRNQRAWNSHPWPFGTHCCRQWSG